jgi:hypothetical protein
MSAVMQSDEFAAVGAAESRYNIYMIIHKALRGFMTDVLHRWGRMDVSDECERAEAVQQARALLAMCRGHVHHENNFIHLAIEKRRPGHTARIAREHVEHLQEIEHLETSVAELQSASVAERAVVAERIYRALGLFVAQNFVHMAIEETDHHRALTEVYSDAEILAIEHAIVTSLSPEEAFADLRWMIPQINATERAFMLGGMRRGAPPEVFKLVMELAREALSQRDFYKLEKALA